MEKKCKICGKPEIEHLKRFALCKKFESEELEIDEDTLIIIGDKVISFEKIEEEVKNDDRKSNQK